MARPYTVTIRARPRAEKERFGRLRDALDAIERRGRELETGAREVPVGGKVTQKVKFLR